MEFRLSIYRAGLSSKKIKKIKPWRGNQGWREIPQIIILAGQNGVITCDKDRNGNIVPGSNKVSVKTEDGKDVYTTISAELQTYLETRMDVFKKSKGKYVSATLVSAKTGEILATTQRPSIWIPNRVGSEKLENLEYHPLSRSIWTGFNDEGHVISFGDWSWNFPSL